MTIEQLRERIKEIIRIARQEGDLTSRTAPDYHINGDVDDILQAFIDAGGVLLAEDQTLPESPYGWNGSNDKDKYAVHGKACRLLIRNNWRKVVPIKRSVNHARHR